MFAYRGRHEVHIGRHRRGQNAVRNLRDLVVPVISFFSPVPLASEPLTVSEGNMTC